MLRRFVVPVLFVSIGLAAGLVLTGRMRTASETSAAAGAQQSKARSATTATAPAAPAPAPLPDLTAVARQAINSVANISSTQIVRESNSPFANDPYFRFFFDDDAFGYRNRRAQSLGSGVVVTSDGYILTNNHVVGDARAEVSVVLPDKRELRAKIIGVDAQTDIALLKVAANNLPALRWGDSSKLKVAEWVLAIGNPFQLNQTVTLGIVSATGRSLEGRLAQYEDFIQTDAAINPGNSGGALVSARGELVGINTAIYSESGGYQGIGFAVPSNLVQHVMNDLIEHGEVRRGTILGIRLQPLTTEIAERLGAPNTHGLLVFEMDTRSDAYTSGVRPGDIIITFNGAAFNDGSHFFRLLSDAPIGSTVTLGLLRKGRESSVKIRIAQATGRVSRR